MNVVQNIFSKDRKEKEICSSPHLLSFHKIPQVCNFCVLFLCLYDFEIRLYPRYFVVGWGKKRRRERECDEGDEGDEGERKKEKERENTYLLGSLY